MYGTNQQLLADIPNEDLHENANQQEPVAIAPPLANMDTVAGYDNVQFTNFVLPPPPAHQDVTTAAPPQGDMQPVVPAVSEEQAREALAQYVSSKCCYGSRAVRDLVFTNISPSTAIHYKLETFTEGRQASWTYEPYNGLPIDGRENGPAPQPWAVTVNPPAMFKNSSSCTEVPHTASVKTCHSCLGSCTKRCWKCHGRGNLPCSFCVNGHLNVYRDGHHHRECCHVCSGSGWKRCSKCNGTGFCPCETCAARGSLKCYILLDVTWTNNVADHIMERTALPDHLIKGVSGKTVFHAEHQLVAPLVTFFEGEINTASQRLVRQHATQFTGQRILRQRHVVRMVPVSEVAYTYNNNSHTFWVYGDENRVYEEDYPLKCCCGCTIL